MADTLIQEIMESKKNLLAEFEVRLEGAKKEDKKFLIKTLTSQVERLKAELGEE